MLIGISPKLENIETHGIHYFILVCFLFFDRFVGCIQGTNHGQDPEVSSMLKRRPSLRQRLRLVMELGLSVQPSIFGEDEPILIFFKGVGSTTN